MNPKKTSSPILIAPSILSADFSRLAAEVKEVEKAGADWLHVDVMDGHFVPNITIGPMIVQAIKPHTRLPLDCHLMVESPEKWVNAFASAGAFVITIHAEICKDLKKTLREIRALGCKAGVSLNPSSSLGKIEKVLDEVDLVLLMSVNPGFGGQKFIESTLEKTRRLREMRGKRKFVIEGDGGITPENAPALREAGCEVFVAGSAIFAQKNRAKAIRDFRKALKN